jgi:hypothetical protein
MTKIGHINNSSGGTFRDSLGAIRHAQTQLRHLTRSCASPTVLASQIELCEVCWLKFLAFTAVLKMVSKKRADCRNRKA